MNSETSRILIGVPTIAICSGILVGAWYVLPENYFVIFLISFALLAMILERFVKKWEKGRKNHS